MISFQEGDDTNTVDDNIASTSDTPIEEVASESPAEDSETEATDDDAGAEAGSDDVA